MEWDALTRQSTVEMDQNSMSESMSPRDTNNLSLADMENRSPSQYYNNPATRDVVMMDRDHSQQTRAQRLGFSSDRGGINPLDRSRDYSNTELKLERERLQKIDDDRRMSANMPTTAELNAQLTASIAMSRSNSNSSNDSSTGTGKSSNKYSGYETGVTTPPSPQNPESPDLELVGGQ
jgi:hypothetical protein